VDLYENTLIPFETFKQTIPVDIFTDNIRVERSEFLKNHTLSPDDTIVGINPGGAWPTKRWDLDRFSEVIDQLHSRISCKIIVILPQGIEDFPLLLKNRRDLIVVSTDSYISLSAVLSCMDVLVTNDSGPMHLAEALHTPVIALFGPTHPSLGFFPRNCNSLALYGRAACSPCSLHGRKACKMKDQECFNGIGASEVTDKIVNVLKRCKSTSQIETEFYR
jgi:heptosyltransferase-2